MYKKYFILSCAVLISLTSCKIKEVEVGKFEGMKFKNIEDKKATIELYVPIKNNNSFGFTISNINMNLALNDKNIGKINKVSKLHIPAKSSQTYPIDIEINMEQTAGNIGSLALGVLKNRINVKAEGVIKVRKFIFVKKIPIHQNETVKLF